MNKINFLAIASVNNQPTIIFTNDIETMVIELNTLLTINHYNSDDFLPTKFAHFINDDFAMVTDKIDIFLTDLALFKSISTIIDKSQIK